MCVSFTFTTHLHDLFLGLHCKSAIHLWLSVALYDIFFLSWVFLGVPNGFGNSVMKKERKLKGSRFLYAAFLEKVGPREKGRGSFSHHYSLQKVIRMAIGKGIELVMDSNISQIGRVIGKMIGLFVLFSSRHKKSARM